MGARWTVLVRHMCGKGWVVFLRLPAVETLKALDEPHLHRSLLAERLQRQTEENELLERMVHRHSLQLAHMGLSTQQKGELKKLQEVPKRPTCTSGDQIRTSNACRR